MRIRRKRRTVANPFTLTGLLPAWITSPDPSLMRTEELHREMEELGISITEKLHTHGDGWMHDLTMSDLFLIQDVCGVTFMNRTEVVNYLMRSDVSGGIFARFRCTITLPSGRRETYSAAIYARSLDGIYEGAIKRVRAKMRVLTFTEIQITGSGKHDSREA